jgi:hypothetical protein
MSAFVVSHDHTDYLVSAAWALLDAAERDSLTPDEFGREILGANLSAIIQLYPGVLEGEPVPGTIGETPANYRYRPVRIDLDEPETLAQVLKACRCWQYQAAGYPESRGWRYVETLFTAALYALPGMESAEWEWTREEPAA